MNRQGNLARNTFILSIGTFLPKLATFITLPILTGYLTQEEYGTYDLIAVLVSLLLPVVTLQIQTAAFRFLIAARNDETEMKKIVTNIFVFIIPSSFVGLIVFFFCLPGIQVNIRLWICAYFFADILVNAVRQIVRGLQNNLFYSISAIISAMGKVIFSLVCVYFWELGLMGAIISLFAADMIALVFLTLKMQLLSYIDFSLFSLTGIRKLLRYSWPMVPNSMSLWVMRMSDRLVVTFFMGISANAVYSVANKIPSIMTLALNTFSMAWQENASMASEDEDADQYYSMMFHAVYNLMAGFLSLLIAGTPVLFWLLIRGDYSGAYIQMPILLMGMFFFSISSYLGGIYIACKDTRSVGITTVCAAIMNVLIDIGLIRWIGLFAASGSTLLSYIFLVVYRMFDIRKMVKIRYNYLHIIVVLVILTIQCFLYIMQSRVVDATNFLIACMIFVLLNKDFIKGAIALIKKRLK